MSESLYAVVMAGGGGTRLWPISRRDRPKQTLKLFGNESLFQATISRLLPLIPPERVRVVTVADQVELLQGQAPMLPLESFIIEPSPRGTASVVGLAAVDLIQHDPGAVMACLPADHVITHDQRLRAALSAAETLARKDHLVTLGLQPTGPETGYGYLEKGERLELAGEFEAFQVRSFKEKPDSGLAEQYLDSGKYLWNGGIFVWQCSVILDEINRWMPNLGSSLSVIRAAGAEWEKAVKREWPELEPQTIDYGVMEKAARVALLEVGDLGWLDVGSWDRLFGLMPADANGNVIMAEAVELLETTGSLVVQANEGGVARLLALIGVEDLIVVDAGDAILVTTQAHAQSVRELVQMIQAKDGGKYL